MEITIGKLPHLDSNPLGMFAILFRISSLFMVVEYLVLFYVWLLVILLNSEGNSVVSLSAVLLSLMYLVYIYVI